jgi:hypothetical protein
MPVGYCDCGGPSWVRATAPSRRPVGRGRLQLRRKRYSLPNTSSWRWRGSRLVWRCPHWAFSFLYSSVEPSPCKPGSVAGVFIWWCFRDEVLPTRTSCGDRPKYLLRVASMSLHGPSLAPRLRRAFFWDGLLRAFRSLNP